MLDASGSIPEAANEEVTVETDFEFHLRKVRHYTRLLLFLSVYLWLASLFSFLGVQWLHTRRQPNYFKVVPRPPYGIMHTLRVSGAIVLLGGIIGWWGALHNRHYCIFIFSNLTFFSAIVEISCGSVTISYEGKMGLLMHEDVLRNFQQVNVNSTASENNFLDLQMRLRCCGVSSYRDWMKSRWWEFQRALNSSTVIPESCCIGKGGAQNCSTGDPPFEEVKYPTLVHKTGCMKKISEYMDFLFHITGIFALSGGLMKFCGFFLLHYLLNIIFFHQQQISDDFAG